MNQKFNEYEKRVLTEYRKLNPKFRRVFSAEMIYERLMRLGVESRYFCAENDDDHYKLALLTLKEDAISNAKE